MDRSLRLKLDIQKVVDAIDDEVDAYIATYKDPRKDLAQLIFNSKRKKLKLIARKMAKKYAKD